MNAQAYTPLPGQVNNGFNPSLPIPLLALDSLVLQTPFAPGAETVYRGATTGSAKHLTPEQQAAHRKTDFEIAKMQRDFGFGYLSAYCKLSDRMGDGFKKLFIKG